MEKVFIFPYLHSVIEDFKEGYVTNFKILINTESINESSPCFSGKELDTSPIGFNMVTEKIIVLF